jgi:Transglycosylase SLT domain
LRGLLGAVVAIVRAGHAPNLNGSFTITADDAKPLQTRGGRAGWRTGARRMFIDSTGAQSTAVIGAIRNAAQATGANFQYLLATAQVESGFNPTAAVSSSSAKGLFQFIDQTWLTTLKEAGPALGYGRYADAIVKTPSGRYTVPDPVARQQIMALRDDPSANAAMAGAFTQQNAAQLTQEIGRTPSEGELYLAHFLGAGGAGQLINLASQNPSATAASVFANAAKANPSIFYDGQGHARSAADVYHVLVARYDVARAMPSGPARAAIAAAGGAPLDLAAAAQTASAAATAPTTTPGAPSAAPLARPGFHSLFSSDGPREPVSRFVRDLWTTNPRVAAALTGQASPSAATSEAAAPGAPMGLFSDQPSDVRSLFGQRS